MKRAACRTKLFRMARGLCCENARVLRIAISRVQQSILNFVFQTRGCNNIVNTRSSVRLFFCPIVLITFAYYLPYEHAYRCVRSAHGIDEAADISSRLIISRPSSARIHNAMHTYSCPCAAQSARRYNETDGSNAYREYCSSVTRRRRLVFECTHVSARSPRHNSFVRHGYSA